MGAPRRRATVADGSRAVGAGAMRGLRSAATAVARASREPLMVIVVFRSRVRAGVDSAALEALGQRMYALASEMPGFVSYRDYAAADGESLTLVEFDSAEHLAAWRGHPEHVLAQERGRVEVFDSYHITVCEPVREYRFGVAEGRVEMR